MRPLSLLQLLLLAGLCCFTACEDDDDIQTMNNSDTPDNVTGLNYAIRSDVDAVIPYAAVTAALAANPAIGIVAEVDHRDNAAGIGTEIPFTRVVLFGNPNLGTPLMQANQRAGIDLPQKMLVYENSRGDIITAYNNTEYLGRRHGVTDVPTLANISGALQNLATQAGTVDIVAAANNDVDEDEGLVEVTSALSFDSTFNQLIATLNGNPNLRIIAQLDHQANAARVNLDLRPTRLVVFGNPNLGTPLMQESRTMGIDLPQKMLVYEDADGTTKVLYNDINYLAERHGVTGSVEQRTMIAGALANIAAAATTE